MAKTEPQRKSWHVTLGLFLILPVLSLGSACVTKADRYQTVGSNDQTEPIRTERKGVAGTVNAIHDGSPIEGAMIVPASLDIPSQPVPERLVLSGSEGQYFWPLKPGAYEFSVSADGYQAQVLRIEIEPESLATLDFELQKAP